MDVALTPPLGIGLADLWTRIKRGLRQSLEDIFVLMAGFSNAVEAKILDATMGSTAFGGITPLKIALVTVAVTDTDDSTTITKATYTGYADINIASTDWNAASAGSKTTANALTFGLCTASSSTVIGFAIYNNSNNEIHMYGTVSSLAVTSGVTPSFAAGALSAALD